MIYSISTWVSHLLSLSKKRPLRYLFPSKRTPSPPPSPASPRSEILLPDIFAPFPPGEPPIHPAYSTVKLESEAWLASYIPLSAKAQAKYAKADFQYFTGIWMVSASEEAFRVGADWMNWAFWFDDEFEMGTLKDDPERAKWMIETVVAMAGVDRAGKGWQDDSSSDVPVVLLKALEAHADICRRIAELGSELVVKRYQTSMRRYSAGILGQLSDFAESRHRSIDEMLELRRLSLGILPCFVLLQLGLPIDLLDEVIEHPLITELEVLSSDLVIIHNDIVSYAKEEHELVVHNLIACCRKQGMNNVRAFQYVDRMVDARFARFDAILKSLPSWGSDLDIAVAEYAKGCKDLVIANAHWSFRSERYFGTRKDEVRKTRKIELLDNPPYLQKNKA